MSPRQRTKGSKTEPQLPIWFAAKSPPGEPGGARPRRLSCGPVTA